MGSQPEGGESLGLCVPARFREGPWSSGRLWVRGRRVSPESCWKGPDPGGSGGGPHQRGGAGKEARDDPRDGEEWPGARGKDEKVHADQRGRQGLEGRGGDCQEGPTQHVAVWRRG